MAVSSLYRTYWVNSRVDLRYGNSAAFIRWSEAKYSTIVERKQKKMMMNVKGLSGVEKEYIKKHHKHEIKDNQCTSLLIKHVKAPVHLVSFSFFIIYFIADIRVVWCVFGGFCFCFSGWVWIDWWMDVNWIYGFWWSLWSFGLDLFLL